MDHDSYIIEQKKSLNHNKIYITLNDEIIMLKNKKIFEDKLSLQMWYELFSHFLNCPQVVNTGLGHTVRTIKTY